jgi:hypothetical protein
MWTGVLVYQSIPVTGEGNHLFSYVNPPGVVAVIAVGLAMMYRVIFGATTPDHSAHVGLGLVKRFAVPDVGIVLKVV